ncbi:MAG TPA: DUF1775 domain-containing protein [Acidimicrobiia bacterium]|nr:DUF1775 domain-containing protein [Acidimicrobiia bacterium]
MNRTRRRGRFAVAALLAAGLAAVPTAAWAHAAFTSPGSVPADSDQTLVLDVPEERGDIRNAKVIVEVPAGFTVSGCEPKRDWDCAPSPSGSKTVVTFTRTSGSSPDTAFGFRVHTPDKDGSYAFEVNQFYADGESTRWDGPPDSDFPAPVLEVG